MLQCQPWQVNGWQSHLLQLPHVTANQILVYKNVQFFLKCVEPPWQSDKSIRMIRAFCIKNNFKTLFRQEKPSPQNGPNIWPQSHSPPTSPPSRCHQPMPPLFKKQPQQRAYKRISLHQT
jgi:hypothetical protein